MCILCSSLIIKINKNKTNIFSLSQNWYIPPMETKVGMAFLGGGWSPRDITIKIPAPLSLYRRYFILFMSPSFYPLGVGIKRTKYLSISSKGDVIITINYISISMLSVSEHLYNHISLNMA